ncbi:manganese efflux pump MntP [Alicyclobacillus acidiphilus]|uniref:manganese efflux pump MntP n=1 Tax=Alicyclobacillus acidiphilus TaxID=182455 RepID=UPI00082DC2E9|nr:manganese efflux pump [Alicyclobacillus acidiphilus]
MGIPGLVMSLVLGVSSNLDNVGIGLSYGMHRTRIPLFFSIAVAVMSFSACFFGALTGRRIIGIASAHQWSLVGSCILIAIGLWTAVQSVVAKDTPSIDSRFIRFHEMMLIGTAQAMGDLSIGFGSVFTGINGWATAASVGMFSFAFLVVPSLIRRWIPPQFTKYAAFLSGVALVVVGLID